MGGRKDGKGRLRVILQLARYLGSFLLEGAKLEAGGNCAVSKRCEKPVCCDPVPAVSGSRAQMVWMEKGKAFVSPKESLYGACCITTVLPGKVGWRPEKRWILPVSVTWSSGMCPCPGQEFGTR